MFVFRGQGGITEGLVKGALSVAASAYKALFTGPNCPIQVSHTASSGELATKHLISKHEVKCFFRAMSAGCVTRWRFSMVVYNKSFMR